MVSKVKYSSLKVLVQTKDVISIVLWNRLLRARFFSFFAVTTVF